MPVSLKDISEKVGINICSVSQVLNNHPRAKSLRTETREKILAAARELGYCKNEMAASMTKKHSRVLALVTAEMGFVEYTGRIQNGVLDCASALDYTVTVHRLQNNSQHEIIRKILGWKAAGVIFHVADLSEISEISCVLDKNGIPWGTVNLSNPGRIGVTSDDRSGVESAVELLFRKGHKRPAFLMSGNEAFEYLIRRKNGYITGMKKYYPPCTPKVIHVREPETEMTELLSTFIRQGVDAVICENDHIASVLIRKAGVAGIAVPEDISVIGFGNSIISQNISPRLTTVVQDFEAMGRETVRLLTGVIEHKNAPAENPQLHPVEIVERNSVYNHGV